MKQELWLKVEELFHAALERAPEVRPAFLDTACNGDSGLRRQIELLLVKEAQAASFLEFPAMGGPPPTASRETRSPPTASGRPRDAAC